MLTIGCTGENIMERKQIQFIRYCLSIGLVVALIMIVAACSSKSLTSSTAEPAFDYFVVKPTNPADLLVGSSQQFNAIATYPDGSTMDISSQVNWTSSKSNIASISSAGLATGISAGTTIIEAAIYGVKSSPVSLTVGTPSSTSPTTLTTPTTDSAITVTTASPPIPTTSP
jgi:hypothetical protein